MIVLNRRACAVLAALTASAALVISAHIVRPTPEPPIQGAGLIVGLPASRTLVIAHRGASGAAPENTLAAMAAATAAVADLVEFDVQRTSDGHLIVVHDTTFARTTDVARVFPGRADDPVGSFTLSQVRKLDAGSWFAPRYAGARVPTLSALLRSVAPTSTGLLLELKNPNQYPGYESQIALDGMSDPVV